MLLRAELFRKRPRQNDDAGRRCHRRMTCWNRGLTAGELGRLFCRPAAKNSRSKVTGGRVRQPSPEGHRARSAANPVRSAARCCRGILPERDSTGRRELSVPENGQPHWNDPFPPSLAAIAADRVNLSEASGQRWQAAPERQPAAFWHPTNQRAPGCAAGMAAQTTGLPEVRPKNATRQACHTVNNAFCESRIPGTPGMTRQISLLRSSRHTEDYIRLSRQTR